MALEKQKKPSGSDTDSSVEYTVINLSTENSAENPAENSAENSGKKNNIIPFENSSGEQPAAPSPVPAETVRDQAARLMDQFGDNILKLAYSYLHNMYDAEEVLQDTLVQFLKTAPDLIDTRREKAWLLRVAGNLAKNRIRYNKVRNCDELEENLLSGPDKDLTFVWDAVRELPVKYREAVHLFYYEGYSTAEIAQILERNESTVRSDLHRAREMLKKMLKGAYDFE